MVLPERESGRCGRARRRLRWEPPATARASEPPSPPQRRGRPTAVGAARRPCPGVPGKEPDQSDPFEPEDRIGAPAPPDESAVAGDQARDHPRKRLGGLERDRVDRLPERVEEWKPHVPAGAGLRPVAYGRPEAGRRERGRLRPSAVDEVVARGLVRPEDHPAIDRLRPDRLPGRGERGPSRGAKTEEDRTVRVRGHEQPARPGVVAQE